MKRLLGILFALVGIAMFAAPAGATYTAFGSESYHAGVTSYAQSFTVIKWHIQGDGFGVVVESVNRGVSPCGEFESNPVANSQTLLLNPTNGVRFQSSSYPQTACEYTFDERNDFPIRSGPGAHCMEIRYTGNPQLDNWPDPGFVQVSTTVCD